MKKVLKKVKSKNTKLNDSNSVSLNGDMLKKIKGGARKGLSGMSDGDTDRLCGTGCGPTAAY